MKNYILLFLLILTSCDRIPLFQEEKTYSKFSEADFQFIPTSYKTQNLINIYKSNLGDTLKLQNAFYNQTEEVVYPPGSLTKVHYYDNIKIQLNWLPIADCNNLTLNISKGTNNNLSYTLVFWSNQNGCNGISDSFNSSETFTQINLGGTNYKYMMEIKFRGFFITTYNSKKLDKVYYDLEKGLVGFENTETNELFLIQ